MDNSNNGSDLEFLKVTEMAALLRIARSRAYELVAQGTIPAVRIGRSVRIPRRGLNRWLEDQRYADAARK